MGSVPGRGCLRTLNLEEPYDIFPISTGCFSGPQLYVKEHLAPAGDLSFQLGLMGVPLAQKETIDFLLSLLPTRDSIEQMVDLASEPLIWAVSLWFVPSHDKCLLAYCT